MMKRMLLISVAFALCLVLPGGNAIAFELPQACKDGYNLQYKTTNPDMNRVFQLYDICLQGNLSSNNRAITLNNRGIARKKMGNLDAAIRDYSQAIQLKPDYHQAINNRGNAYIAQGKTAKAMDDYNLALSFAPQDPVKYRNRGLGYMDLKDYNSAIADYTTAIKLNPGYAKAYANRAFALKAVGDVPSAREDAKKARQLDPGIKVPTFE